MLEDGPSDSLRNPAVYLALDDRRVDDDAAVLDDDVAQDRDLAGLDVHLNVRRMCAAGESARVGRNEAARELESGLNSGRKQMRLVQRAPRDVSHRHPPGRGPAPPDDAAPAHQGGGAPPPPLPPPRPPPPPPP